MNFERYAKQMNIPEFGVDGQEKLEDASVLIIGAGGVGSTVIYALAAAGVGTIGIADPEIVKVDDLNRQFIHFEEDLGTLKVTSASRKLRQFNSLINVIPHAVAINKDNAYEIIAQYDIVALAVNSFQAKIVVNQACYESGTPLVVGSVGEFCGTCAFIDPANTPCLQCLYGTEFPPEDKFASVSSTNAAIGAVMSDAIIQYLLSGSSSMAGQFLYLDTRIAKMEVTPIVGIDTCPICGKQKFATVGGDE